MIVNATYHGAGSGLPLPAENGQMVTAILPAGCVLRVATDHENFASAGPTPILHAGPRASYRIDCISYGGSPVTATLSVG